MEETMPIRFSPVAANRTACEHLNFKASVRVGRLTEEDEATVKAYVADIGIVCAECGLPFRFLCSIAGVKTNEPTVSVDALELRAPLEPAYVPEILGIPAWSGRA